MSPALPAPRDLGFGLLICALLAVPLRLLGGGADWLLHPVAGLVAIALGVELHRLARTRADMLDLACAGVALLLLAGPATGFAAVALLPLALMAARRGRHGAIAATMLAGLAVWAVQDGPIGQAMAGPVIGIEAGLAEFLLRKIGLIAMRDGATLQMVDGRSLVILRGCSVESVLFPTLLGAMAARRLTYRAESWPPLSALLLPLGLVAVLNLGRLLAMCISAAGYAAMHTSPGIEILEVAMILPIGAALWPEVRRVATQAEGRSWRDALRRLPVGAAVVALCCGLVTQNLPVSEPRHPLAERGFVATSSVSLVSGGAVSMQVWRDVAGCRVFAADFETPDATLPLMRNHLKDAFAGGWGWWLGTRPMPEMSPLQVNAWRIAGKFLYGATPKSLITVDPEKCLRV